MEELLQAIKNDYKAFEEEAEVHVGRGNASAGIRARKLSMQIAEKLKQFRAKSVDFDKQRKADPVKRERVA